MRTPLVLALLAAGCVAAEPVPPGPPGPPPSYAAWLGLVAYPARGQSPEQQRDDDFACYQWAGQETRIDPGAPAPAGPPPGSGVASGAATGAVAGAILGGVLGRDPLGGAVVGGMTGAVAGAAAEHQARVESQRAQVDVFRRGFAACLEGRGYTVR